MPDSVAIWFQQEILCHEAALVRYLTRRLPRPADVQDVRHDIYVRVLEAAERERPRAARAFLFTVARHILVDRSRRDAIVRMDQLEDVESSNVLIDELTPERRASDQQQLQRLSRLLQRLPARCRDVVWMRRVENVPQKLIARRLDIAEATVEKHLVRGIRLLSDAFHGKEDSYDD